MKVAVVVAASVRVHTSSGCFERVALILLRKRLGHGCRHAKRGAGARQEHRKRIHRRGAGSAGRTGVTLRRRRTAFWQRGQYRFATWLRHKGKRRALDPRKPLPQICVLLRLRQEPKISSNMRGIQIGYGDLHAWDKLAERVHAVHVHQGPTNQGSACINGALPCDQKCARHAREVLPLAGFSKVIFDHRLRQWPANCFRNQPRFYTGD